MTTKDDKPLTPQQARQKLEQGIIDYLAGKDPGAIVFRLKRTKKASETYPLKLTQLQRESLLECTRIKNKLKGKLKEAESGTQIIGVTRRELDQLNDEIGQNALNVRNADKRRLLAVLHQVVELLSEDLAEVFGRETPKTRGTASKKGALLYQFKITLLQIKPAIWRRIQVPDCTLNELHQYIQAAFGWWNYHLHRFEIDGERYSEPAPDGDDFGLDFKDESDVLLSKLIPNSVRKTRWIYEYDFGDGWRHEVLFEGFPPADPKAKYPLCLEGERACPPEDCGGPWSYPDYLAAIKDPWHDENRANSLIACRIRKSRRRR